MTRKKTSRHDRQMINNDACNEFAECTRLKERVRVTCSLLFFVRPVSSTMSTQERHTSTQLPIGNWSSGTERNSIDGKRTKTKTCFFAAPLVLKGSSECDVTSFSDACSYVNNWMQVAAEHTRDRRTPNREPR